MPTGGSSLTCVLMPHYNASFHEQGAAAMYRKNLFISYECELESSSNRELLKGITCTKFNFLEIPLIESSSYLLKYTKYK